MTVNQAAEYLGVKPSQIRRMEYAGTIERIEDNRRKVLFRRLDLDRYKNGDTKENAALEVYRLRRENDRLRAENRRMKAAIRSIYTASSEAMLETVGGGEKECEEY